MVLLNLKLFVPDDGMLNVSLTKHLKVDPSVPSRIPTGSVITNPRLDFENDVVDKFPNWSFWVALGEAAAVVCRMTVLFVVEEVKRIVLAVMGRRVEVNIFPEKKLHTSRSKVTRFMFNWGTKMFFGRIRFETLLLKEVQGSTLEFIV